jgi:tetratricopeptide (TPR) repeat protein
MSAQLEPEAQSPQEPGVSRPSDEPASGLQPAVDAQHPWLGLASFTEETRGYFHGREEEVAELARRVQRKLLTILFGQSGLGKTSILRAGIVPRLRPEGYCPVYVRVDYSPESPSPSEQIKQAIFRATGSSGQWTRPGVASEGESLWEFLHHRDDLLLDADGKPVIPLLIFDQFEEIFTLAQADDAGRKRAAQFIEDLADLVENRLPKTLEAKLDHDESVADRFDFGRADYRILIALREDYLAHLESVKGVMPSITQNRMRLARMNGQQALAAVLKPGGKLVSQEVAESIVRFIAGGSELPNAEVEPSLLSLICRELNNTRIAQGRAEISADLLAGSHDTILAEFYERALADQPEAVRKVIEDHLLTDSGFRESLAEERVRKAFADAGAAPDALATLVNRRLLRIEERLDMRRVELTHDVLCGVVKSSRQMRLEREALEEAERQLAAQRAREAATRKALVRARQIAVGCALLAIIAVGAGIFGVVGMKRAQEAEAKAQQTEQLAEAARSESERLIVYLLDDFYRELEPVGRLEIVGELAKRALDYYQGLPIELRGIETQRNQALAQSRYGAVLRNQGRLVEARQMLDSSIPTLDELRSKGDSSEATAIGLALGLMAQARLDVGGGRENADALVPAARAVDVLKAGAQAPEASVAIRRAYAAALTQLGFIQQRTGRNEEALVTLQAALGAYRGIDDLQADNDAAANFGITSGWLMDALDESARPSDALRVGDEGRRAASQVLERQPTHMLALRARALLSSNVARVSENTLQQSQRLAAGEDAARDWQLLSRIDPTNVVTLHNLGVARNNAAEALWDLGRPREALAKQLESNAALEKVAPRSSMVTGNLSGRYFNAAVIAGELGQTALADKYRAEGFRLYRAWVKSFPADSYETELWARSDPVFEAEYAVAKGDLEAAREESKGAREGLLQLKPGNDPGRRRQQAFTLRRLHAALGRVELESKDFVAAERHYRYVAEARRGLNEKSMSQRRLDAEDTTRWALALARSGRLDEARPKAAQALAFERELHASKPDDQLHKWNLTVALVASANANPQQAKALLAEAQSVFDTLPAEARALRTSRWIDGLITDARSTLR